MADEDDWAKAEVGVTWDTYVELGKPSGVKVFTSASISEDGAYVCSTYVLGDAFLMPGNIVRKCSGCGHLIQLRPHVPTGPRLVCVTCAVVAGMRMPGPDEIRGGRLWKPILKGLAKPAKGHPRKPAD